MKRAICFLTLGFVLGALSGQPAIGAAAQTTGLVHVGIINAEGATLHVQGYPSIPSNAVEIYYGSNVVIYDAAQITATPGPGVTRTPTRISTLPAAATRTATPTITPTPTVTPSAILHATVRKFPRLLVMSQAGGNTQVGVVGYGVVLAIREEVDWWGRIDWPVAGWIDLTWCEVSR